MLAIVENAVCDLKSHRWGYGLQYARSRSTERLEDLLLLTTLGTMAIWRAGLAAKATDVAKHFQANTEKRQAVLSIFFLGRRLLKSTRTRLPKHAILDAMKSLPGLVHINAQHA